jgi:hypothetical protein
MLFTPTWLCSCTLAAAYISWPALDGKRVRRSGGCVGQVSLGGAGAVRAAAGFDWFTGPSANSPAVITPGDVYAAQMTGNRPEATIPDRTK